MLLIFLEMLRNEKGIFFSISKQIFLFVLFSRAVKDQHISNFICLLSFLFYSTAKASEWFPQLMVHP